VDIVFAVNEYKTTENLIHDSRNEILDSFGVRCFRPVQEFGHTALSVDIVMEIGIAIFHVNEIKGTVFSDPTVPKESDNVFM
jgi:ATP-dependent RNA circularization protein (DNA/RNA ligase family)